MPYTATHVLVSIILIELFREYFVKSNNKFPRYYILIAAIAGVFSDFEYIFQFPDLHRAFLHSLFVPLIFLVVGLFIWKFDIKHAVVRGRHLKLSAIAFIFSGMTLVHIILDSVLRDGAPLFYPFSDVWYGLSLVLLLPGGSSVWLIGIDTALLFFWIFWMEFKLKVDDYF
jgi:membrane-bound metal-dependent hydrolase YbcI (DUF457 family)